MMKDNKTHFIETNVFFYYQKFFEMHYVRHQDEVEALVVICAQQINFSANI